MTGLNVDDRLTADLVFAQVSTEHPIVGNVPSLTFLGTRFENLRIPGRAVGPVIDPGICGAKPEGDRPYLQDQAFISRVSAQYDRIGKTPGLSDSDRQQYHWDSAAAAQKGKVECSLVSSMGQAFLNISYGHIVVVPGFGRVSLAELTVDRAFHLTMIAVDSGRIGKFKIADATTNGTGSPGHGH